MIVNILLCETIAIFTTCLMCIKCHCSKCSVAYQKFYIQINNILFHLFIYDFIFTIQGCVHIRNMNFLFKVYKWSVITHPFQKLVHSMNTAAFMGCAGFLCDKAVVLKDILYYVVSYETNLIQNYAALTYFVHTAIIVGTKPINFEVTLYLLENITDTSVKLLT